MSEQGQPTSSDSRAEATPLLEVRGLCKSFWLDQRRIDVLQGLDLTVYEGEMVAIVGASGEGKSTLLHLLGTLDSPSAGSLHISPCYKTLHCIGMLHQEFELIQTTML